MKKANFCYQTVQPVQKIFYKRIDNSKCHPTEFFSIPRKKLQQKSLFVKQNVLKNNYV